MLSCREFDIPSGNINFTDRYLKLVMIRYYKLTNYNIEDNNAKSYHNQCPVHKASPDLNAAPQILMLQFKISFCITVVEVTIAKRTKDLYAPQKHIEQKTVLILKICAVWSTITHPQTDTGNKSTKQNINITLHLTAHTTEKKTFNTCSLFQKSMNMSHYIHFSHIRLLVQLNVLIQVPHIFL